MPWEEMGDCPLRFPILWQMRCPLYAPSEVGRCRLATRRGYLALNTRAASGLCSRDVMIGAIGDGDAQGEMNSPSRCRAWPEGERSGVRFLA